MCDSRSKPALNQRNGGKRTSPRWRRKAALNACHRLAVDRRQVGRIVARPGYLVAADESCDLFQVSRREFKRGGCEVFLQVLPTFGARNRNDVIPLVQQPGERDLARRGRFFLGELANKRRELHVLVKVFSLKAGVALGSPIIGR